VHGTGLRNIRKCAVKYGGDVDCIVKGRRFILSVMVKGQLSGRRKFIMSILGVNGALAGAYQYANRTQKTAASGVSFTEQLQKTSDAEDTSKVETYRKYLEQNMVL